MNSGGTTFVLNLAQCPDVTLNGTQTHQTLSQNISDYDSIAGLPGITRIKDKI